MEDQSTSKLFTILQDPPASSISLPLTNPCPLREFIPSIKEVTTPDESFITHDLQNHELDDGEHRQNANATCKLSKSNNSGAVELVQTEKTDAPHCALTLDAMQGNQNYPRHVPVHVVDERFNGQPKILTNSAASNISESQNNTARSSVHHHQSFSPCPPFSQHNQDDYHSFLQMSSTFSSLVVSTLLQNPVAHAAASFAATFWPYANAETSAADSPVCTPPSMTAITAATVAAATAWWAAHGLLPLCTPLHTPFACPPAPPTAPPSMAPTETQHKIQHGEAKPENPPLQDQILDPEQSEVLQAQHSVSNSPGVSSSESEEKGDTNVNIASKVTNDEMNQVSENPDSNKMNARKPVDRSSCGSNTTSSGEETEILEKDEKEKEEPNKPETNLLGSEPNNRRSRSISNLTNSWKEVSEEV